MTAINTVRFRVTPGRDQEFLDAHKSIAADWPGLTHANIIKTGDRSYCIVAETVDQETNADHLAVLERMGQAQEGGCRHAPGDEIVARGDVDAEGPAGRQQHHQHKNRNQEKSGEIAGE